MSHTPPGYLTKAQVLEVTGLSASTIEKRVRADMLHPVKSPRDARMNLYRRAEVEALLTP